MKAIFRIPEQDTVGYFVPILSLFIKRDTEAGFYFRCDKIEEK